MTASFRRRVALVVAVVALLALPRAALADSRTDFLIQRLQADDFRVRTNAALALGATNDDAAVSPLCGALDDTSEVVRQASAVALKRLLRPQSLDCVKRHLATEKIDAVKLQLSRAAEAIEAVGGAATSDDGASDPPKTVASARYYVAIAPVTNNTSRPQGEIDKVVLGAIRSKLEGLGAYQLAPPKESADAARAVMAKRKLKGFYLTISLDKLDYSGDGLRVTVRLVIFNYPGKAMQGMLNKNVSQPGLRPGDKSAEDNLINVAVGAAIDAFAQNAGNF